MEQNKPARMNVLPSDIDQHGNVVLWDHGPRAVRRPHEADEAYRARSKADESAALEWRDKHGDRPVPVTMHSSDANHAMTIEPHRYAMEPHELDEGDIARRIKGMQDKRQAARDQVQYAIDRKAAIAAIVSERTAAASAEQAAEIQPELADVEGEHD